MGILPYSSLVVAVDLLYLPFEAPQSNVRYHKCDECSNIIYRKRLNLAVQKLVKFRIEEKDLCNEFDFFFHLLEVLFLSVLWQPGCNTH